MSAHLNLSGSSCTHHLVCLLTWIHLLLLPIHQPAWAHPPLCSHLPGVCHSAHHTHTHTHTPGALLCKSHSDNQNDEVGLVLFGLQRQPRFSQFSAIHRLCLSDHPTPAAPSSLDPKAFYLSNLLRATCLLPKSSKWSPRKSLDKSVEMCVQGCPLQNCL